MKELIIIVITMLCFILIVPAIYFAIGYFIGFLVEITLGTIICNGLTLIGISILPSALPLLCGTFGAIVGIIKLIL